MALTVKLSETNFFPVTLNMLEPEDVEFKLRIDWINQAIKAGFKISHQEVFQFEHNLYLIVILVRENHDPKEAHL